MHNFREKEKTIVFPKVTMKRILRDFSKEGCKSPLRKVFKESFGYSKFAISPMYK